MRLKVCFEDDPQFLAQLQEVLPAIGFGEEAENMQSHVEYPGGLSQLQQDYEEARANGNINFFLQHQDQIIAAGLIPEDIFEAIITSMIE